MLGSILMAAGIGFADRLRARSVPVRRANVISPCGMQMLFALLALRVLRSRELKADMHAGT